MENFCVLCLDSIDVFRDDGMQRYLDESDVRVAVACKGPWAFVVWILQLKLDDCLIQRFDEDGTRQQKL